MLPASYYPLPQSIAMLAITRQGLALAGRILAVLPEARLFAPDKLCAEAQAAAPRRAVCFSGPTRAQIGALFADFDAIIAILSLGILVRLLAPHLLGRELGVDPVLTTASDVQQTLAVDLLGRELDWALEADKQALLAASAAVVNEEPVALVQEAGGRDWWGGYAGGRSGPLPGNIRVLPRIEEVAPDQFAALLWVSHRPVEALEPALRAALAERLVVYRPPLEDKI